MRRIHLSLSDAEYARLSAYKREMAREPFPPRRRIAVTGSDRGRQVAHVTDAAAVRKILRERLIP